MSSSLTFPSSMASSSMASSPLRTKIPPPSHLSSLAQFSPHFLSKPFKPFLKPLTLTPSKTIINPSSLSLPHCHRIFSSSFDGFEANEDNPYDETLDYGQPVSEGEVSEGEEAGEFSGESRLYVGNLSYTINSSALAEIFEEAGRVVNVEVIYDRVTDRSRGFGFVTMATIGEAKEAIRLYNGAQIGGRTARVNFPEVPKGGEREIMVPKIRSGYKGFVETPYKIYVGNLGWGLTSQTLRDAFVGQPGLLSARVIFERDSGRSRGFGFVSFESAEDAEAALITMNGVEVEGRPLRLNYAEQRQLSPTAQESIAVNDSQSSELVQESQQPSVAAESDTVNDSLSSELLSNIGAREKIISTMDC